MDRLKLYDSVLKVNINKKEKNKFKKIAYRNKKTISEFARSLIQLIILIDEMDKKEDEQIKNYSEYDNILSIIRRVL